MLHAGHQPYKGHGENKYDPDSRQAGIASKASWDGQKERENHAERMAAKARKEGREYAVFLGFWAFVSACIAGGIGTGHRFWVVLFVLVACVLAGLAIIAMVDSMRAA
jgi:hypothetical protein